MSSSDILTAEEMDQALSKMADQIILDKLEDFELIGIHSRGVPLAEKLAVKIKEKSDLKPKVGVLDIQLYRDDLSEVGESALLRETQIPFRVKGRGVILVDDVLYTGRTIRAAMDAVTELGRPKFIKLAVLIERGWRELPIQADYIGQKVETKKEENVKVNIPPYDTQTRVFIK